MGRVKIVRCGVGLVLSGSITEAVRFALLDIHWPGSTNGAPLTTPRRHFRPGKDSLVRLIHSFNVLPLISTSSITRFGLRRSLSLLQSVVFF